MSASGTVNQKRKKQLSDALQDLEVRSRADLTSFYQAVATEGRRGRQLMTIELLSVPEAIEHPLLGPCVVDGAVAAYRAAQGLGNGLMAECFCCCGGVEPGAGRARPGRCRDGNQPRPGPSPDHLHLRSVRQCRRSQGEVPDGCAA
jgi:hypothetical protein